MDWRWPPTYGSGPFAPATPCTHVPGRYSGPNKFNRRVAHPWSWDIGSSTSAAQTSLNMVRSRRKARPFGLSTKWGFRKTVDHPRRERRCGQGLIRWTEKPRAARPLKGASDVKRAVPTPPSAWRRRNGLEPAPARTSERKPTTTGSSGRVVCRRLTTAPGSDPVPPAAYLRASTEHAGHPVAASTAAIGGRLGGGPAHDDTLHRPRPCPGSGR